MLAILEGGLIKRFMSPKRVKRASTYIGNVWSPEILAHSTIVHDLALLAGDVNRVLDGTTAATMTRLYAFKIAFMKDW